MKFLDKRLLSLVAALGLSLPTFAQDEINVADEAIKGQVSVEESEKIRKIQAILKQQIELEADGLVEQAGEDFRLTKYSKAAASYKNANVMYNKVSKSEPRILKKITEVQVQHARALRFEADKLVEEAIISKDGESKDAFVKALANLDQAKRLDDRRRLEIDAQIKIIKEKMDRFLHVSKVDAKGLREKFENDAKSGRIITDIFMAKAKKLYADGRYMEAKDQVEEVLINNPYNQPAVNLLQAVNRKLGTAARQRFETSYQEYLAQVEWKWSEPINRYRALDEITSDVKIAKNEKTLSGIYKKLQIVIPKVRFVDKDLAFVVDFIKRNTREMSVDGEGLNIFVAVKPEEIESAEVDPENEDAEEAFDDEEGFGDEDEDVEGEEDVASAGRLINLDADNMPVGELIKYICQQLSLRYKVEEHAIIIGDSADFQTLETNFYTISAGLLEIIETKSTDGGLDGLDAGEEASEGSKFQSYFSDMGISFPPGAKIKFVAGAMRLVVTNTPDNHERLKEVLRQIGIETPQVSIEAKFIEVNHVGVDEFGFEWRVGRPNHMYDTRGFVPGSNGTEPTFVLQNAPFAGQTTDQFFQAFFNQQAVDNGDVFPPLVENPPFVVPFPNATPPLPEQIQLTEGTPSVQAINPTDFTAVVQSGFNFVPGRDPRNGINHQPLLPGDAGFGQVPTLDSGIRGINDLVVGGAGVSPVQAGVRMILGDFALQGMIRALEQESTNDILSAPQVTAVSGQSAVIKIIEERTFPESWDAADISASFIFGTSPQFGDPQDVGIVFEVTPTVEPDGYTISLELKPQILELKAFDQSFNTVLTNALTDPETGAPQTFPGRPDLRPGDFPIIYEMPILTARTIETRVTVWDGESIMLGGLIQERVTAVDDKVPYVSDLPLIGRLFRNKGQQNIKRNLLIFVTARLIDKAGLPKKAGNTRGLPDFKRI